MVKPRFVAGAVCPQCRLVDRIVVEVVDGARRQRCVACGYTKADVGRDPGIVQGRLQKPPKDPEVVPVNIVGRGEDIDGGPT